MNAAKSIFCVMLFVLIPLGTLCGQVVTGANRPATVPFDYVITPFGYFHPSCVGEVKAGEMLLADGRIRFEDGSEATNAAVCSFPHYTPRGELVGRSPAEFDPLYISWSWIEASQVSSSNSYGGVAATWTVPPTPLTNDGQTLFFFPALSHAKNNPPNEEPIIQPVLGWNDGLTGGGWNIASWNCCPGGMTWHSSPVVVSPGDQIQGSVMTACGALVCSKWNITTKDITTQKSTTLVSTFPTPLNFVWAQAGVLEIYNIYQCSDFPPDGSITFSNVALLDFSLRRISQPGWTPMYWVQQGATNPWCNYSVTSTDTTATLTY